MKKSAAFEDLMPRGAVVHIGRMVEPKIPIKHSVVQNKNQAQALATLLWNEMQRHMEDVKKIREDLSLLRYKWGVCPIEVREFLEP